MPGSRRNRGRRDGFAALDRAAGCLLQAPDIEIDSRPASVWVAAERHRISIPADIRSTLGIFYTPPHLAERLLDDVEAAGARYDGSQVVCDPACGGGAFLVPAARRIAAAIADNGGAAEDLSRCLVGIDIDPGGLAITSAALDSIAVGYFGATADWNLTEANTLGLALQGGLPSADIVVGNPPFGRLKLSDAERRFFERGVVGHANVYGLFVDVALRIAKRHVGFVMPTSWLAGAYFSRLRDLVSESRPLTRIRFVEPRSNVFPDVLQEMCLAVFDRRDGRRAVKVFSSADVAQTWTARVGGPNPWPIARCSRDADLLRVALTTKSSLADYGYMVHTGPLVWNRRRDRLRVAPDSSTSPIVWADALRQGEEVDFRDSGRTTLYLDGAASSGLALRQPAVLVKRTTAKEQARRIIAAPFRRPPVVVENHLNMVIPAESSAVLPIEGMSALLNSEPVDRLFRCLSGTVAVSATELRVLPLPRPEYLAAQPGAPDFSDDRVLDAYSG